MTRAADPPEATGTLHRAARLVVDTPDGRLEGALAPGGMHRVWRAVPYAAPPVGALRFAAPERPVPWAGTRDATLDGPAGVQAWRSRTGPLRWGMAARRGRSENSLTLNVWSPGLDDDGPLRPVVVWLHGGSFNSGNGAMYDGGRLAELGDVVVVTVNYRLGGFGFVNLHDPLGGDERIASNPGLRDQLAALQWVHRSIASFGGDPGRVTLAGESAGSSAVTLQLAGAGAHGLVHGAIAQSGSLTLAVSREDADRTGHTVLDELGVSRERIDRLWRLPASEIVRATVRAQARRRGALVTRPWFDGDLLPATLAASYGALAPVPLLIGSNLHEHRTFTKTRSRIMPRTRDQLATVLVRSFGWERAERILAAYPDDRHGLNDLGTDLVFRMPGVHVAEALAPRAPVFHYRFDYGAGLLGFGAFHAIELLLLFPQSSRPQRWIVGPGGAAEDALAERFTRAWLGFVRNGTPGDDWPAYDPGGARTTRIWDRQDRLVHDLLPERRVAWAGGDAIVH